MGAEGPHHYNFFSESVLLHCIYKQKFLSRVHSIDFWHRQHWCCFCECWHFQMKALLISKTRCTNTVQSISINMQHITHERNTKQNPSLIKRKRYKHPRCLQNIHSKKHCIVSSRYIYALSFKLNFCINVKGFFYSLDWNDYTLIICAVTICPNLSYAYTYPVLKPCSANH